MDVIKRDGTKVEFNLIKIEKAISAANASSKEMYNEDLIDVVAQIRDKCRLLGNECEVEQIQDIVEDTLIENKFNKTAEAYIKYRNQRTKVRQKKSKLVKEVSDKLFGRNIVNQNANVDEVSFGGRKGEASDAFDKQYALDYCISELSRNNHLNNEIYIHDLSSYAIGNHNCLSVPFDKLLAKGFTTRQCDIRPANSADTAFQLVAVIFQIQSLQQFGGVSATHLDWTMVPYVRKSFFKHYRDGVKYLEDHDLDYSFYPALSIDEEDYKAYSEKAYKYALEMTEKEVNQAAEGLFHNLNSLQSRSGCQVPFSSINFGTCTLPEGRMVIKALLNASIEGVGKHHLTPIFPCSIFQYMRGVNDKPGTPNYDMYQLALKSTSKRLYPNYMNCGWSGNVFGDEYDVKVRQEYIDNLSETDYNNLIEKLKAEPELQNILGLILEEGDRHEN